MVVSGFASWVVTRIIMATNHTTTFRTIFGTNSGILMPALARASGRGPGRRLC